MSTPAEILALQHAQANELSAPASASTSQTASVIESVTTATTYSDDDNDDNDHKVGSQDEEEEDDDIATAPAAPKSFPVLGSSSHVSAAPLSWGPGSKISATAVSNGVKKSFSPSHVKATNSQVTFIIGAEQQLNVTKAELFKILGNVKKNFNVNVESTFSTTSNKRTFLLTGPHANIEKAKRDIVKQLTKPVRIEFKIPSKLRSTIIGAQGKNLKPIIEATGVKIDIARGDEEESTSTDEDAELFGALVPVIINGDIEGCEEAKSKILQIVAENTKSLSVRVPVSEKLSPFITAELENLTGLPSDVALTALTKQNVVVVNGPRESAILARDTVKQLIETLDKSIVIENRNVPKTAHQFLNPETLFEKVNVKVEIPDNDSNSNIIVFTGTKQNIQKAIELGKSLANDYITDALDIGRSHGGNTDHAKNLISYFKYVKLFDELSKKYNINIISPSYKWLSERDAESTAPTSVVIQFSCFKDQKEDLKKARKEIIDNVNKVTPTFIRSIDDISSFIINHNKNKSLVEDSQIAKSNNITLVPLCKLSDCGNKLLMVLNQDDDEFLPSLQEINDKLDAVSGSLDELRTLSKKIKTQVVSIPFDDQAKINEASLRIIINKFDANSIDIKLYQNDKGYSKDEILLIGYEKEINSSVSEINQLIDDIKNYETASKYNTIIQFPTQHLSKLIGQKGVNLKAISDEFDVRLDVRDDDSSSSPSEETNVKLTGVKSNVDECIKKIQQLNKRFSDEKTVTMKVESKYHGKIIGKNGSYANRLRDKYNVVLRFSGDNTSSNKDEIMIRGPSKSVAKVEEEIKELVQYEKENGFESIIKVPVDILPHVIGRNGELINDISADAGIEIHTGKRGSASNGGVSEIQLIGSKKGIKEATDRINSIVERAANHVTVTLDIDPKWHKNLIGQGGSVKREIVKKAGGNEDNMNEFRKFLQIPNKDSESKKITLSGDKNIVDKIIVHINKLVADYERVTKDSVQVPKKKHKVIIGFRGAVKRSIQEDFDVFVDIPSIDSESDLITIEGLPENIEKAKAKITELVA